MTSHVRFTTEADLQAFAVDYLQLRGWLVAHFRPARTEHGWRTPVAADGKGFPDLCVARRGIVELIEVKGPRGRFTDEQRAWCQAGHAFVLWPDKVDEFVEAFR